MANFNVMSGQSYTLGSSISSTQTTVILSAFKVPVTETNITMASMNTDIAFGTLAPGTSSAELISFTGVTQNADGTATLTGVTRGLDKQYPYTESSAFKQPHAGQTIFILSDAPQVFDQYATRTSDETITGKYTFPAGGSANAPVSSTSYSAPTDNLEYVSKQYVDGVAVSGAPDANTTTKGIVEEATQAEVDAKTATGGTGAKLFQNLSTQRSTLLSDYKADTGAANAYVITPVPAISAYTAGQIFSFKAANANTTTSTLNVNGLGVKTIKKLGGISDLASGDIAANQVVVVEYDGTNFQMQSPIANLTTYVDFYGPGTDGDVTISSNTTLTKDMFYNNLTINNTFTLNTGGYRIFVKGTLTNNGTIANNGSNASGATGGAGGAAGSVGSGGAGANSPGLNSGAGGGGGGVVIIYAKNVAVQGTVTALGGNGGNGGVPIGANIGTAATAPTKTLIQTGTGGKGGNATNAGGAAVSGNVSGMSTVFLATTKMFFDFISISLLSGGVGGSSGAAIGGVDSGGGGGGQGGFILFVYSTLTTSGSLTVTGGTGGNGQAAGLAGNAGSSGLAVSVQY